MPYRPAASRSQPAPRSGPPDSALRWDDLARQCQALARHWNIEASPAWTGRALLGATGLVVTSSVSALHPSRSDWLIIASVSAVMVGMFLLSFVVPWGAVAGDATFLFPASVVGGLAALAEFTRGSIPTAYLGLIVLCFAYVGVYNSLHSCFALLVLAVPTWVVAQGQWNALIAIRLSIAVCIWVILAEVLALLTRRQLLINGLLERAALIDGLTGVGTRRDLDTHVSEVVIGDTLVICDVDHFKAVNDTLGHAAGDAVLRDFGTVLRGCLRGDDYAGRYGGEEFVLILSDTDEEATEQVLLRLRVKWAATGHDVTFSAGFATHRGGTSPAADLGAADAALYSAKSAGRDRSHRAASPAARTR